MKGDVAVNADDHVWLIERFREQRRVTTHGPDWWYLEGRIVEFCNQNAVTNDERETARQESLRLADTGGAL